MEELLLSKVMEKLKEAGEIGASLLVYKSYLAGEEVGGVVKGILDVISELEEKLKSPTP